MSKFQAPRGTQDVFGNEMSKWHFIENLIRQFMKVYHVEEIRTPIFEHTEVFKREMDSSDMVNKEMYTFTDFGGRSLTLRPEGTAGLIRSFVENKLYATPDYPVRYFYLGPNFRYERPQKGRFRIHHQFGIETLGIKSPLIDAEVIQCGYDFLRAVGLNDIQLLINTLGDQPSQKAYQLALFEHFNQHIEQLCPDCQRRIHQNPLRILDCKVDAQHHAITSAPSIHDYLNVESKDYFQQVCQTCTDLEIPWKISDRLVRGLDYYSHTVFELISNNPAMGSQSTLIGGGRYDDLVSYFGGPSLSGIGFGMGIERLLVAAESEGISLESQNPIDVYIMPLDAQASSTAFKILANLRKQGYQSDMDFSQRSLKSMFKSAERLQAKVIILLGEQELALAQATLKHISSQTQITIPQSEIVHQIQQWLTDEVKQSI